MKVTFDDGREAQFQEMMQQLNLLQAKYKGVRGELLAKVRDELARLKPAPSALRVASTLAPDKILPSCRMCGRGMRLNDDDGSLVCEKGHTRPPARAAENEAATH